jgi:hypothetical protein
MGLDPKEHARAPIVREGGVHTAQKPFSPEIDVQGRYQSRGNENAWGQRLADLLTNILNMDFAVIVREYDRAVRTEHPGLRAGRAAPMPTRPG